ncbi:hypothetical protein J5X98_26980 [Leptothermofonsia sichuanensis E412]|uniref:hypothetical protein n=1 Tax=Leptothermofonsia sichuanensis TaxID=2917832 RepID=UPI001CA65007|nr:hypothetical protein [Leptothermofonsia sichuanensis]QZZ20808.1 hypothetical protein J5X98_26980 [Leptothermofonsia sichuanensis E412]
MEILKEPLVFMDALFKTKHITSGMSGIHFAIVLVLWALAGFAVSSGGPWHRRMDPENAVLIGSNQKICLESLQVDACSVAGFKPRRIQRPQGPTGGAGTRLTS